jgi:hypothetical protein
LNILAHEDLLQRYDIGVVMLEETAEEGAQHDEPFRERVVFASPANAIVDCRELAPRSSNDSKSHCACAWVNAQDHQRIACAPKGELHGRILAKGCKFSSRSWLALLNAFHA